MSKRQSDPLGGEQLGQQARELGLVGIDPSELERMSRRLRFIKESLQRLEPLLDPELEPLPTVDIEVGK